MGSLRVLRNAASNYVRFFVFGVISFILTPLMVHGLGDEGYGLWVMIFSLTGYFGLVDQGIRPSLVRYVSRYKAAGDDEGLSRTLSSAIILYSAAGLVTMIGALVVAAQFHNWFRVDPAKLDEARTLVLLAGTSLAMGFPFGVFGAALSGLQRYDIANVINIAHAVSRAILFVIALKVGGDLITLGWIALITDILARVATLISVRRLLPRVPYGWRFATREHLRLIGAYSGIAFVGALATSVMFKADSVVISAFLGSALVTPFALAAGLVDNARTLVLSTAYVLAPAASELETLGQDAKLRALLMMGSKYSVIICWPVLLAFMIFGSNLFATWVGPAYASAGELLTALSIPTLLSLPLVTSNSLLYGISRHRGVVTLAVLNAALNLGLSLLWVRPFGLMGVALGTAIPLFLIGGVATGVYTARVFGVPALPYFWHGILRPGLLCCSFVVPALLIQWLWHPMGWIPLGLAVGVSWLVSMGVAWQWAIDGDERARWGRMIPRLLGRAPAPAIGGPQ